jgi:hypothetical protein
VAGVTPARYNLEGLTAVEPAGFSVGRECLCENYSPGSC